MIKYLGSKRRLLPILGDLYSHSGARTALDLFTGTTRVAQDFKRRGATVTAVDLSRYSEVFANCWITTDANEVSATELSDAINHLNSLEGEAGYFTHTFCVESRFFQPHNGARIDAIRTTSRDRLLNFTAVSDLVDCADTCCGPGGLDHRGADGVREEVVRSFL
jgi:adenine-specific DNA-methyltransferase